MQTELRKKEIELSLEKEQNKQFWDQTTDNSITIAHLRRELDTKAAQLQRMENAVKETRAECHRHMERQVSGMELGTEPALNLQNSVLYNSGKLDAAGCNRQLKAVFVVASTSVRIISKLKAFVMP